MDWTRCKRVEDEYKIQFYNLKMEEPKEGASGLHGSFYSARRLPTSQCIL